MKAPFRFILLYALAFGLNTNAQTVPALVNYQGQLSNPDGTALPTADYTLTFNLYDAATNGTLVWGPQVFDGAVTAGHGARIPVVQGYFNVILGPMDTTSRALSDAFNGATRYVEITVSNRPPIAPRQQILTTPFAFQAANAATVSTVGGQTAANVASATVAANAAASANTPNTIVKRDGAGNFSAGTITASLAGNATTANSFSGSLSGDVTGGQSTTVVASVGGQSAASVASGAAAANAATSANGGSTIVKRDGSGSFSAGTITVNGNVGIGTAAPSGRLQVDGDFNSPPLLVLNNPVASWGTVGNFASYRFITTASAATDGTFKSFSVAPGGVSIGYANTPPYGTADAMYINGNVGIGTTTPGFPLTFANGLGDKISLWGQSGTHYGFGIQNNLLQVFTSDAGSDIAFGSGSSAAFAETMRVKGNGNVGIGTSTPQEKLDVAGNLKVGGIITIPGSSANFNLDVLANKLRLYAQGGGELFNLMSNGRVGLGIASPNEKLHVLGNILATGTITPNSDRNAKTNFAPVDTTEILRHLLALPISQWRFKNEAERVKHVGPMAQDFRAEFGLGAMETAIATVDADGVALAAIQGLNQKLEERLKEKAAELEQLKAKAARIDALEARLDELERKSEASQGH